MKRIEIFPLITTKKQAEAICGKLSYPSKMPGPAYSIPNAACHTGGKLRKVKGSVCEKCYAGRNNYLWPAVQQSMTTRLISLAHPQWVDAIVFLISDSKCGHFRWHDSGDLQSPAHLEQICEVARRLPDVGFYLPTKEKALVKRYLRSKEFPKNLVVRVSAAMIDGEIPDGVPNASVVVRSTKPESNVCPAKLQDNKCGECRACWDPKVHVVYYPYH